MLELSPLLLIIIFLFAVWLGIIVPWQMAGRRNRSPLVWVLISILFSPVLAILLLFALGNNPERIG